MIIFILMLVFTIIITGVAIGVASYAAHITDMISGDKLLYMNVEEGYKYATTFRDWQFYGNIAVAAAIIVWIIFIIVCVSKIKKRRKQKAENMMNFQNINNTGYQNNVYQDNTGYQNNVYQDNTGYQNNGYSSDNYN